MEPDTGYICPEDKSALVFNDLAQPKFCDNPECKRCLELKAEQALKGRADSSGYQFPS